MRDLDTAAKIEHDLIGEIKQAIEKLEDIHAWGPVDLDRDALWTFRARVQDAMRVMHDLKPMRKLTKQVADL